LMQSRQHTPIVTNRSERRVESKPQIDGLLACVALLRQMMQGAERLLKGLYGLAVGRPRHGLLPGLPEVRQGLVPHFAAQGLVGQAFGLLGPPVPSERFEGRDDAGMQRPPSLLEQTTVGHLMGQGMLEGVLTLGKETRLIEKLGRLEVRHAAMQRVLRQLGNGLEQGEGYLGANYGGGLEQALFLRW